jgi:hypothetical protein
VVTRTDTTLKSAYGTTPEQARDARARAWMFVFDCYAKKAARTEGGEDSTVPSQITAEHRKTQVHST